MDTLNKLNIFSNRSYTLKNLAQKNIQQNKSNIKMNKTKFVSHKLWIILILIVALSGCSEKKPVQAGTERKVIFFPLRGYCKKFLDLNLLRIFCNWFEGAQDG